MSSEPTRLGSISLFFSHPSMFLRVSEELNNLGVNIGCGRGAVPQEGQRKLVVLQVEVLVK